MSELSCGMNSATCIRRGYCIGHEKWPEQKEASMKTDMCSRCKCVHYQQTVAGLTKLILYVARTQA